MVYNNKNRIRRTSSSGGRNRLLLTVQKPKNSSHYQKNIEKQFQTAADIERGRTFGFSAACDYKQYSYFEKGTNSSFSLFLNRSEHKLTTRRALCPSENCDLPVINFEIINKGFWVFVSH
jgi:hypothetical protein